MWNERLYLGLGLGAAGVLLLAIAGWLRFLAAEEHGAAKEWSRPSAESIRSPAPDIPAEPAAGSLTLPFAVLGVGLLGSALFLVLRQPAARGYAGPRGERTCRHCRQRLKPDAIASCPKCGAAVSCPQCGADLTQGAADVCQACGAPWGCQRCGHSLKGLASNPCPVCQAPALCHRCGADLHYNITGRCAYCGARIAGWREWR